MVGYYYYLTKIRPYFTQGAKADSTLLLFTLLTILIFGGLGLRPLLSSTIRAYVQLRDGERYENQLSEKISATNGAWANLSAVAGSLANLGRIIPEGVSQPQVIQELDRDAGAAGVTLRSVAFRPGEEKSGGVKTYVFDFLATGTESQLLPFLTELESGQLFELQTLQTTRRREEGGWKLEIVGRAASFFIP